MSIPKVIHYCWLGGPMPENIVQCIESCKRVMPEYKIVVWDENKFDVNSIAFTREACEARKWAFASDYIRIYALYTEGGIYMDTDVFVRRKFDDLLDDDFFTSLEYHKQNAIKANAFELLNDDGTVKNRQDGIFTRYIGIQAAVLGGVKGHPFLKSCLDWYADKHFILPDGQYYDKIISPAIYADVMIDYGFRYKDELQKLDHGMTIYPSYIFAGNIGEATEDSYSIHCCNGSWRDKSKETLLDKVKNKLVKNNVLRKMLGKEPYRTFN